MVSGLSPDLCLIVARPARADARVVRKLRFETTRSLAASGLRLPVLRDELEPASGTLLQAGFDLLRGVRITGVQARPPALDCSHVRR